MRRLAVAACIVAVSTAAGCSSLGYYWQALNGQVELTRKARAIPEVISDPTTPAELKVKLERVQHIRTFASAKLLLPDNGSYRSYADLGRPFVVWNVFAAPALSVQPEQWCFPVAGCVGYRGYFNQADAERFAEGLRKRGLDVFVGGVPAYSTLGWFDDPVLNTFIRFPETEVARLIFHELAHQLIYVQGDSTFNESFATAVELEGVQRWLGAQGTDEQRIAFDEAQVRRREFALFVTRFRDELAELYAQQGTDAEKLAQKAVVLQRMRSEYATLKLRWGGFTGYDWWFGQPLNNAQLASVAIYTQLVPGFQRLLAAQDGDLTRFYAEVRAFARTQKDQRDAALIQ